MYICSIGSKDIKVERLRNVITSGGIPFESTNTVLNNGKLLHTTLKLAISGWKFIAVLKLNVGCAETYYYEKKKRLNTNIYRKRRSVFLPVNSVSIAIKSAPIKASLIRGNLASNSDLRTSMLMTESLVK